MSGSPSGMSMLRDRLCSPQFLLCRCVASPGGAGDYTCWTMNKKNTVYVTLKGVDLTAYPSWTDLQLV